MKKSLFMLLVLASSIFTSFRVFSETQASEKKVFVIPIHGEINKPLMVFVRRSVEKAKIAKSNIVIFDIDTFGGRVDSALQITTLIGSLKDATTIAYITAGPESTGVSWSAGALISFSCNEIYMAPGTSMGAAAPVYQTNEGMKMAEEKVVSAVRTQMAAFAQKNNYPTSIALAMVDSDVELLEIYIDSEMKVASRNDLVDIKRELKRSNKKLEEGKIISEKGKLLTLTANEMEKYGVSKGTYDSQTELVKHLGISESNVTLTEESSSDKLISFLTSGVVMTILIAIALVALYVEINSPGFGIPGTISLISFAIIFASNIMLGQAGSFEIIIFIVGVILLILEIFIIPGFGVAGISGIILIVLSLILSMQDFIIPTVDWEWGIFFKNVLNVGVSFVISIFIMMIIAQALPKASFFQRLALNAAQNTSEGFTVQDEAEINKFIGKKGISVTTLRPSGKAEINGEVVEVVSDGEFVEKGTNIEVIDVTSNKIIIRKC